MALISSLSLDAPGRIPGWWHNPTLKKKYDGISAYDVARDRWLRAKRSAERRERRSHIGQLQSRDALPDSPDEGEIRDFARARSGAIGRLILKSLDVWDAYAAAANYAATWVDPPRPDDRSAVTGRGSLASCVLRLASVKWWRQQVRRLVVRRNEAAAIRAGRVHRRAAPCASDACVEWRRATRDRHAQLLLDLLVVNENGESVTLAQAAEAGQANPILRRHELMVRIRGLEEWASARDHVAVFVTWTLASEFHARLSESGQPNPRYAGASPREGHHRLVSLWARARAAASRAGIEVYGFRGAEPHHDATPHWHLLMFGPRGDVWRMCELMRRFAMEDSPNQPGAQNRRINAKVIEPGKGTAAGYVAKYVAKCVDGQGIDGAWATDADGAQVPAGDGALYAERVTAWARAWGIRQFQFFGAPAVVGVYRELRRVREPAPEQGELFEAARLAADAGQWAPMLGALEAAPLEVWRPDDWAGAPPSSRLSAYADRAEHRVRGLVLVGGTHVVTRPHTWSIVRKAPSVDNYESYPQAAGGLSPTGRGPAVPWTRGNNCSAVDKSDTYAQNGSPASLIPGAYNRPDYPDPDSDQFSDYQADQWPEGQGP